MTGFPRRYAPWLLRDLALTQGIILVVVSGFVYFILTQIPSPPPQEMGPSVVRSIVGQFGWPFILFCVAAMVSGDRTQGYYRSLFSRPVSPPLYYLTRFLAGAVIVFAMVPLVSLATGLAMGGFPFEWRTLARVELNYLLVGGLVFLASNFTRLDWLIGLTLMMLQSILASLPDLPRLWNAIYRALPPFSQVAVNAPPLDTSKLIHVLVYGVALVLAALAVLRWRPLGAGGRS